MKNRKTIIIVCLALSIIFLSTGTFAYFRFGATGNININTGELMLSINDKSATQNEQFEVILTNEDGSNLKPGDSGSFELTLNATGSSLDVSVVLEIIRTNLPTNLKFYEDEEHTIEFTSKKYDILKSDSMIQNVTIYWYWKNLENSNDNDFMFTEISATINGIISYYYAPKTLYNDLLAMNYTLDTNVDFAQGASETNGQGLMMRDGTQNDEYPVLYYRGDVANNNVIYADKCWLIVRTTEAGGIKLIYNGEVNEDGSCNNYSGVGGETPNTSYTDAFAETSFNESYDSPVYVGYMYNDDNLYYSDGTLDVDGYKSHLEDNTIYEVELSSANNSKTKIQLMGAIDQATGRHTQNIYDSNIKQVIDAWYFANIDGKSEESLLEDTVWCADRSITSATFTPENYATNGFFVFGTMVRVAESISPSLTCNRDIDKFTVDSANGNGDLTHPVGMLTADEILMAGNTTYQGNTVITYLSIPTSGFWTLSPVGFFNGYAHASVVNGGELYNVSVDLSDLGVRPSVSLGFGAYVTSGNGTFETPYIVE